MAASFALTNEENVFVGNQGFCNKITNIANKIKSNNVHRHVPLEFSTKKWKKPSFVSTNSPEASLHANTRL